MLRAVELRLKTRNFRGSLCLVLNREYIFEAMKFHDVWDCDGFISNPFYELSSPIYKNMTEEVFRVFIEYTHHWNPPFTSSEISSIIRLANKFGYKVTTYKSMLSFRRDINNDHIRLRYRNSGCPT